MRYRILTLAVLFVLLLAPSICLLEGFTAPIDEQVQATGQWLSTRVSEIPTVRALMTREAGE